MRPYKKGKKLPNPLGWVDRLFNLMSPIIPQSRCRYMGLVKDSTGEPRVFLFGSN